MEYISSKYKGNWNSEEVRQFTYLIWKNLGGGGSYEEKINILADELLFPEPLANDKEEDLRLTRRMRMGRVIWKFTSYEAKRQIIDKVQKDCLDSPNRNKSYSCNLGWIYKEENLREKKINGSINWDKWSIGIEGAIGVGLAIAAAFVPVSYVILLGALSFIACAVCIKSCVSLHKEKKKRENVVNTIVKINSARKSLEQGKELVPENEIGEKSRKSILGDDGRIFDAIEQQGQTVDQDSLLPQQQLDNVL